MKKQIGLLALVASMAVFTSCDKDVIRGSGNTVTESRAVAAFTSVEITGNKTAEIIFSNESKVELTGYQNILGIYQSKVENGKLFFEYPHHQVVKNDNIRLKIYTPALSGIKLTGNGDVKTGAGLHATNFLAELSGNGKLKFLGGQVDKITIRTSGNSDVSADPVNAKQADVEVSGNANVKVKATESIKIRISGSGEVNYWGNPADIDVIISGNGHAHKH